MPSEKEYSANTGKVKFSMPSAEATNGFAFWHWEVASDQLTVSDQLYAILDQPNSKFNSINDLLNVFSPDSKHALQTAIHKARENSNSFIIKGELAGGSDNKKAVEVTGNSVSNAKGKITGVSGVCQGVPKPLVRGTDGIKKPGISNEEIASELLEHSPNALLIHTPSGIILYVNDTTVELLKAKSREELIGQSIQKFTKKENHKKTRERIAQVLKSRKAASKFEQEFICLDGSTRTGESIIIPIEWEGKTEILSVVRDITEQKKYLRALESSAENMKQLIKSTPLSLAMFDKDMNYIACSSKFLEDWWVKEEPMDIEKIVGLNHYEIFEDVKDEWKQLHQKCLKGATILKEDDFFIKADGKKEWVRWQNTPWRDIEGKIQGLIIFTEFITERKETEELIKESQSKLSTLLENLPGMVYGCNNDKDWTVNFVSNGSIELTGYKPDEFLKKHDPISFKKITHPEDVDYVWDEITRCLEKREIFEVHYRIFTKSGELKHLFERGQGVFDEKGNLLSLEGIILDVSRQKAIEDRLRKSEANLAEAQRLASLGSWEWYIESKELLWSDEYYRICGLDPDKTVPSLQTCINILHPADRSKAEDAFKWLLKHQEPLQFDVRILRKNREIRYVSYKAGLVYDEDGKAIKIVGSIQDITEKKEAEVALQESENRNKALLSALPDIIFILSVDGTYLDCQVPDRSQLLYSQEDFLGKNLKELFEPELASLFLSAFKTAHDTNTMQTVDYSVEIDGHDKYFEARIVRYKRGQVLAVVRDNTKTKKSEIEAKESEKRFYKAFHISPIPITISDIVTGELLEVNDKFLQLVNMKREEVVGHSAIKLGFWASSGNREAFIKKLKSEGQVYGFDGLLQTNDNEVKDVLLSAEADTS